MKFNARLGTTALVSLLFIFLAVPLVARGDTVSDEDFFKNIQRSLALVVAGNYFGTGFVVTEDGFMLTAAHVVGDKLVVEIIFNPDDETKKKRYSARVILSDYFTDVAVLKIFSQKDEIFQAIPFGDSEELVAGYSDINIVGYPTSIGGRELYIGSGKVTQLNILLTIDLNVGLAPYIRTNIIGGKGGSGGPCLYRNKVIGIAGALVPMNSTGNDVPGLSMCVSGVSVKQVLDKAIEGSPVVRGKLDVTLGQFDPSLARELNQFGETPSKKFLSQLFIINPHKSGLRPLDRVVSISFQDELGEHTVPIGTAVDFKRTLGALSPGVFITVVVIRAGEEMRLRVRVDPLYQSNMSE